MSSKSDLTVDEFGGNAGPMNAELVNPTSFKTRSFTLPFGLLASLSAEPSSVLPFSPTKGFSMSCEVVQEDSG